MNAKDFLFKSSVIKENKKSLRDKSEGFFNIIVTKLIF